MFNLNFGGDVEGGFDFGFWWNGNVGELFVKRSGVYECFINFVFIIAK